MSIDGIRMGRIPKSDKSKIQDLNQNEIEGNNLSTCFHLIFFNKLLNFRVRKSKQLFP